MVAIASAIAVPFGVGVAVWLVEYGRTGWFANVVRYFVDVMTGVPSVVFGLFVYIVLVVTKVGGTFAAWKGAVALALLMLPVVTRSAEVVLQPRARHPARGRAGARRPALAGHLQGRPADGAARHRDRLAARGGPRRGRDRAAALHVAFVYGATLDLAQRMNSLPLQIFNDVGRPRTGSSPARGARR